MAGRYCHARSYDRGRSRMGWLQWRENGSPAFAREFCPSTLSSTGSMVVVGFLNQSIKSPTHNTAQDQVHRTRRCEKTYFTGANKTTKRRRASASPRARHGVWLAGCASATPPYSFSRADVFDSSRYTRRVRRRTFTYTTCYNHGWGYNARENVESSIACRDASCMMYGSGCLFSLLHSIFAIHET